MCTHSHSDIEEVCLDLVGAIRQHTGENVESVCARNLFIALCIPETHRSEERMKRQRTTANAAFNNYDGLPSRAAAYLKEKRSSDARSAMGRLLSGCLEIMNTMRETAVREVLHEAFTHEGDTGGKSEVWKPTTTQLNGLQNYLSGAGTIVYMHHPCKCGLIGDAERNREHLETLQRRR